MSLPRAACNSPSGHVTYAADRTRPDDSGSVKKEQNRVLGASTMATRASAVTRAESAIRSDGSNVLVTLRDRRQDSRW